MTFKTIRFVADSTCDIPPELLNKWKIGIVPAFVNYGGKSYADDGVELDRVVYYNQMPTMTSQPTTSAPPPALVEKIIRQTFDGADHLVMLTVPATLSGIYNAFRLGASQLPQDRVTLIDSGTVAMGLGFQTLIGAEVAAETGDVSAVLSAIQRVRANQQVYAAPETMEYLRRSGRVSWATASVGALLQIKPIVSATEDEVKAIARVRTFSKAVDKLIELVQNQAPLDRLALIHANNPEGAQEMKTRLGEIAPAETFIINVTPVIGTHIGPGALGVATVSKAWRT
jgi:fatty acid kinase fatty acid binding subunit